MKTSLESVFIYQNSVYPDIEQLKDFRDDKRKQLSQRLSNSKEIFCFALDLDNLALFKKLEDLCCKMIQDTSCFGDYDNGTNNFQFHYILQMSDINGLRNIYKEGYIDSLLKKGIRPFVWLIQDYNYNNIKISDIQDVIILRHIEFLAFHANNPEYHHNLRHTRFIGKDNKTIPKNVKKVQAANQGESVELFLHTFGNTQSQLNKDYLFERFLNYYERFTILHLLNFPNEKFEKLYEKYKIDGDSITIEYVNNNFNNRIEIDSEMAIVSPWVNDFLKKKHANGNNYFCDEERNETISLDLKMTFPEGVSIKKDSTEKIIQHWLGQENAGKYSSENISQNCFEGLFEIVNKHDLIDEESKLKSNAEIFRSNKIRYVDSKLEELLLYKERGYEELCSNLNSDIAKDKVSNVNLAISFLELSNNSKNLKDGDIYEKKVSFDSIKNEIKEKLSQIDKECKGFEKNRESVQKRFVDDLEITDGIITSKREVISDLIFELNYWFKKKQEGLFKKFTIKSKSVIYPFLCIVISCVFLYILHNKLILPVDVALKIGGVIILISAIIGGYNYFKFKKRKEKYQKELILLIEKKRNIFAEFVDYENEKINKRFEYYIYRESLNLIENVVLHVLDLKIELEKFRYLLIKKILKLRFEYDSLNDSREINNIDLLSADQLTELFEKNALHYCFANENSELSNLFFSFYSKRYQFRDLENVSFNREFLVNTELENEVINPIHEDENSDIIYDKLDNAVSFYRVDGKSKPDVKIIDVKQGRCGDCYFMAALAAIARKSPITLFEIVKEKDNYFQVTFINSDKKSIDVQINNKFWLKNNTQEPQYADICKCITVDDLLTKEIWVMIIEKAFAKLNGLSYECIVGSNSPKYDFGYALTGKSAKFLSTDEFKDKPFVLLDLMKKHFLQNNLPIELYSKNEPRDTTVVANHAYALWEIKAEEGFLDIFNPWNDSIYDGTLGKHYKNVDINFLISNFDSVLFFNFEKSFNNDFDTISYLEDLRILDFFNYFASVIKDSNTYKTISDISVEKLLRNEYNLSKSIDKDILYEKINEHIPIAFKKVMLTNYHESQRKCVDFITGYNIFELFNRNLLDCNEHILLNENRDGGFYINRLLLNLVREDIID